VPYLLQVTRSHYTKERLKERNGFSFLPQTTMASLSNIKPNIGVYTDPKHNLWLDEAQPSAADIQSGAALDKGEVVVEIRSTGICGFV
jgi:hypothetical protein